MGKVACLPFNFVVVFDFNLFPVSPSKAKSTGDVPMNRQNAANSLSAQSNIFAEKFRRKNPEEKI